LTEICTSAKAVDGDYYVEAVSSRTLDGRTAVRVIAIPLFGILFSLVGFLMALASLRHTFSALGLLQRFTVILMIPTLLLHFFLYFGSNEGWKYGAFLAASMCVTIASFGLDNKFLSRFALFFNMAVLLFLVGPNLGNNVIFSAGSGVFSSISQCGGDQGWVNHWSINNVGMTSSVTDWNPQQQTWGFCAPGFLTWQGLVAVFVIVLTFFTTIFHLCSFGSIGGGEGAGLGTALLK